MRDEVHRIARVPLVEDLHAGRHFEPANLTRQDGQRVVFQHVEQFERPEQPASPFVVWSRDLPYARLDCLRLRLGPRHDPAASQPSRSATVDTVGVSG